MVTKRSLRKDVKYSKIGKLVRERLIEAEEMAESPTKTVTLRIPEKLNEWLDSYVHLSYPDRIKKQELIIEGLILCYMFRGKARDEILRKEDVFLVIEEG